MWVPRREPGTVDFTVTMSLEGHFIYLNREHLAKPRQKGPCTKALRIWCVFPELISHLCILEHSCWGHCTQASLLSGLNSLFLLQAPATNPHLDKRNVRWKGQSFLSLE